MSKLNSHLVLIKVDEAPEQDELGIYTQESWVTNPPTGEVIDVAADVTFCEKGDKVFFERYTSIPHPVRGKEFRVCREDAVLEVL